MDQRVDYSIIDESGNLVEFHKKYEVIRTEVLVWTGKKNHNGRPIAQEGIRFIHTVRERE